MTEWLPDGVVYAITYTLAHTDLPEFYKDNRGDSVGGSFYDPISMLGILMYATLRGKTSSCMIEHASRV